MICPPVRSAGNATEVPESPRWLFIHGGEEEAEAIVGEVEQETGQTLPEAHDSIRVRQRKVIPFREIARVAFRTYPKRSILCLALFVGSSEIFPMETRALAIAFFYAIGTAVGGISGPLLFGHLIATGEKGQVAIGFFIGAAVMAVGGVAELLFGVKAAGRQLEDIAEPLSAAAAEGPAGHEELTREDAGRDETAHATRGSASRTDRAPPPTRAQQPEALPTRPGRLPNGAASRPSQHLSPNKSLTIRSCPSSGRSTSTAPPSDRSSPASWRALLGSRGVSRSAS
jgi:hypothetical protein